MSDQLPVIGGELVVNPDESPGVSIAALGNGMSRVRLVVDERNDLRPVIAIQAILALAAVGLFFAFAPLGILLGGLFFISFLIYLEPSSNIKRIVEVTCPEDGAIYLREFLLGSFIEWDRQDAAISIHREMSRRFPSRAKSSTVRVATYEVDGSYMRELRAVESSPDTLSLEQVHRASGYVELPSTAVAFPSVDEVNAFARRRGDVPGKDVACSLLKLHELRGSLSPSQGQRLDTLVREFLEVAGEWDALRNGPYEPSTEESARVAECFELLRLPVGQLEGEFLRERRGRVESKAQYLSEKYGSLEGSVFASSGEQGGEDGVAGKDVGE